MDPLAAAVEAAWLKGVFVVVSGGNAGQDSASLDSPAIDPFVLAVGASDPNGTEATGDDVVASFTSRGTAERGVDLLAPGKSIVSLRVPGSMIDLEHPEGRTGDHFFRGSGSSQAAAVMSGVAALLIQQRPDVTPDELKALLLDTETSAGITQPWEPALGNEHLAQNPTPNNHSWSNHSWSNHFWS